MSDSTFEERWKHIVFNKNITEEESLKFYETWAATYDDDQIKLGFTRQFQLAEKLVDYFPDVEQRKSLKILDIAAGTGLAGMGLFKEGFKNLDAVDGSEAMLEKLRAKCIYSRTFCCVLGDKFKKIHQDIFDESYDIVIIMGGFAQSHLPINSLYQAARALKPGGLFLNLMTKIYLEVVDKLKDLEPCLKQMEKEGIWKKLEHLVDNEAKQGIYHIYRKL